MLQRLLSALTTQKGVEQALMVDDRGRLMASIGQSGTVPDVEPLVQMTSTALEATQHLGLGELYEIWEEGETRTMIDIVTPYRILMLHGQGGKLARWRHSVDVNRKSLAITPEM